MKGFKGRVVADTVTPLAEIVLTLLVLLDSAQVSVAYQEVQQKPDIVLASQGPDAVIEFVRRAHLKGSDIIVTFRNHRYDADSKNSSASFGEARLSSLDDGFLHSSVVPSRLHFTDYTPYTAEERRRGRSSGRKRQINITRHPNRTSIQLMFGSEGLDIESIRLPRPKLPPVTKVKSISVVIDQNAVGRPVSGTKIDSGYRLRYGSANDPVRCPIDGGHGATRFMPRGRRLDPRIGLG